MWRPRRWGRGAASERWLGLVLKTCVMRCRWRSAHNGLASLNSNLLSSQRDTQGRAARPRFLQSVCPSDFVSISPCLPPRYSIYLTGFLSPTYFFISFCCLYPTKTCTIFLLLTLWQPQISAMNMTVMYIQSISMIDQGLSLVIDVFFSFHETAVLSLKFCIYWQTEQDLRLIYHGNPMEIDA